MNKSLFAAVLCLALLCQLAGCAPTPGNAQVEAAIREALAQEESPPDIDFSLMTVPARYSGKALAVVYSADGDVQRGYIIGYDAKARSFTATLDYSKQRDENLPE